MGEVFLYGSFLPWVGMYCKEVSAAREFEGANSPINSRREANFRQNISTHGKTFINKNTPLSGSISWS